MKADIAKKWVEALRSGDYKQCRYVLRDDTNSYCCLGVLCDIYSKETGKPFPSSPNEVLRPVVMKWAGLADKYGTIDKESGSSLSLGGMNDCGRTFADIANIIENNASKL